MRKCQRKSKINIEFECLSIRRQSREETGLEPITPQGWGVWGGALTSALLPNMNYSFDKKPSDGFWDPVRCPRRLTTPSQPDRVNIRRGWQRCDMSDGRHNKDARLGSNPLDVLQLWLYLFIWHQRRVRLPLSPTTAGQFASLERDSCVEIHRHL